MWADTLLDAERMHLIRMAIWGGASVIAGTIVLALLAARRSRAPLPLHFAIQTAAWGALTLALAAGAWRSLALRDVSGAASLLRTSRLNLWLDAGYIALGATLAVAGWLVGRRRGAVGAGVAIVAQGLALLVLDARFVAFLQRAVPG